MKARNPHDIDVASPDTPQWVELAAGRALHPVAEPVLPARRPIDLTANANANATSQAPDRRRDPGPDTVVDDGIPDDGIPDDPDPVPETAVDDAASAAASDAHAFSGFVFAPNAIPEPTRAWQAMHATILSVVMTFFAGGLGLCAYVLVKR
jgi:hypothetical protein